MPAANMEYYLHDEATVQTQTDLSAGNIELKNIRGSLMLAGPVLQLWRAPVDNDIIRNLSGQEEKPGTAWYRAGIDRIVCSRTEQLGDFEWNSQWVTEKDSRNVGSLSWTSNENELNIDIDLDKTLPELPRVGIRFELPEGFENLCWYGRGLKENYPDRKAGYPLKVWDSTVTDEYVPYILPQEHGAHCDSRWVELESIGPLKQRLRVSSYNPFIFSALHSSPEDLDTLGHTWQVKPRKKTILIIDAVQRGLGTFACGPDVFDKYKVYPGKYSIKLKLELI